MATPVSGLRPPLEKVEARVEEQDLKDHFQDSEALLLLVIVGIFSIIDRGIDRDRPHTSRIPIAITIVILSSISRRPDEDGPKSVSSLEVSIYSPKDPSTSLTPLTIALMVAFRGPSTVLPSSVGPQLAE